MTVRSNKLIQTAVWKSLIVWFWFSLSLVAQTRLETTQTPVEWTGVECDFIFRNFSFYRSRASCLASNSFQSLATKAFGDPLSFFIVSYVLKSCSSGFAQTSYLLFYSSCVWTPLFLTNHIHFEWFDTATCLYSFSLFQSDKHWIAVSGGGPRAKRALGSAARPTQGWTGVGATAWPGGQYSGTAKRFTNYTKLHSFLLFIYLLLLFNQLN